MSGGRLNIPSTITDPSYRYTMPKMQLKQESRLNGVKTNVTNLADVAQALRVPDASLIKYFCAEVGANQEQETIIKGSHTYENLLKLLDKFIAKYVTCARCKYPECAYEVSKKEVLAICNACGNQKKLDTTHKAGKQLLKDVPTFYANNPEFKGKTNKAAAQIEEMKQENKKRGKKGKKEVEVTEEDLTKNAQKRAEQLEAEGGEINVLDAKHLELDDPEIGK